MSFDAPKENLRLTVSALILLHCSFFKAHFGNLSTMCIASLPKLKTCFYYVIPKDLPSTILFCWTVKSAVGSTITELNGPLKKSQLQLFFKLFQLTLKKQTKKKLETSFKRHLQSEIIKRNIQILEFEGFPIIFFILCLFPPRYIDTGERDRSKG